MGLEKKYDQNINMSNNNARTVVRSSLSLESCFVETSAPRAQFSEIHVYHKKHAVIALCLL